MAITCFLPCTAYHGKTLHCRVQTVKTSVTSIWPDAAPVAAFCSRSTSTAPPSRRSTTRPQRPDSQSRRRPVPADRVPTAPSAMTARPGSTTARRRATDARVSSVARCARVTSTPVAFSAAASSTRTSGTSAATADFASASGQACAKKVSERVERVVPYLLAMHICVVSCLFVRSSVCLSVRLSVMLRYPSRHRHHHHH